ncbi:MAG: HlyD family secretion protein [Hominilimicola sp.]
MLLRRKIIAITAITVIIIGAVLFVLRMYHINAIDENPIFETENDSDASIIDVYDFSSGEHINMIETKGTVISENVSYITTELSAKVSEVYVSVGDYVQKGDVLCVFDTSELKNELSLMEAEMEENKRQNDTLHASNVKALQNAIEDKESNVNQAIKNINNIQNKINSKQEQLDNLKKSISSNDVYDNSETDFIQDTSSYQHEMDTIISELDTLYEQLDEANEHLELTTKEADRLISECQDTIDNEDVYENNLEYESLKKQLSESIIRAPQSGTVTSVNMSKGMFPYDEIIMTISDMENLKIKSDISESDIFKISSGMKVLISTPALENDFVEGKVESILYVPQNDFLSDDYAADNKYTVTISFSQNNLKWIAGMSVGVKILLQDKTYLYDIPNNYISGDETGKYIFIAEKISSNEYNAVKKYVDIGIEYPDKHMTEIYFNGINDTTKLIKSTDDFNLIYDGMKIDNTIIEEITENSDFNSD